MTEGGAAPQQMKDNVIVDPFIIDERLHVIDQIE